MSNFYQGQQMNQGNGANPPGYFRNFDQAPAGQGQLPKDQNGMYAPPGQNNQNNYLLMNMGGYANKDLQDWNQRIPSLKKLDRNSTVFVPGGNPQQNQQAQGAQGGNFNGQQGIGGSMIPPQEQQNHLQQIAEFHENGIYSNNIFQNNGNNQKMTAKSQLEIDQIKYAILRSQQLGNNQNSTANPQMDQNFVPTTSGSEFDLIAFDLGNNEKIDKLEAEKTYSYILCLRSPEHKDEALRELNNRREKVSNLAPILWYSTGTIAILLQELLSIYPYLSPPTLSQALTDRICNVLGLYQCIALNSNTRPLFLQANLHLYLYPLINTSSKQRPFEQLRVTS
jgi:hypothetical protein